MFLSPFQPARPVSRAQRSAVKAALPAPRPQFAGSGDEDRMDMDLVRAVLKKMRKKIRVDLRTKGEDGLGLPWLPDVYVARETRHGNKNALAPDWTLFPRQILDQFINLHENDMSWRLNESYKIRATADDAFRPKDGYYQMMPEDCVDLRDLLRLPPLNKSKEIPSEVLEDVTAQYQKNPNRSVYKANHGGVRYVLAQSDLQALNKPLRRHRSMIPQTSNPEPANKKSELSELNEDDKVQLRHAKPLNQLTWDALIAQYRLNSSLPSYTVTSNEGLLVTRTQAQVRLRVKNQNDGHVGPGRL